MRVTIPAMTGASNATKRYFFCPHCGAGLTIPADSTATRFKCGECGQSAPVPSVPPTVRYPVPDSDTSRATAVAVGVCLLIVIGFVMSMQPVSLMSGSAVVWTGAAVVAAGTAAAFFLRAAMWVRVVAAVVLALALINAISLEHEMSKRRDEVTRILHR